MYRNTKIQSELNMYMYSKYVIDTLNSIWIFTIYNKKYVSRTVQNERPHFRRRTFPGIQLNYIFVFCHKHLIWLWPIKFNYVCFISVHVCFVLPARSPHPERGSKNTRTLNGPKINGMHCASRIPKNITQFIHTLPTDSIVLTCACLLLCMLLNVNIRMWYVICV